MFGKVDRILGSFAVHNMESRMFLITRKNNNYYYTKSLTFFFCF